MNKPVNAIQTRSALVLLALLLNSCGQLTARADSSVTVPAPTGTAQLPTATFTAIPATATLTPGYTPPSPSPLPPSPTFLPTIIPDAWQVEHWQEYQTELAKAILSYNPKRANDPAIYKKVLCEWNILGESGMDIYVWVVCDGVSVPALIHSRKGGGIQSIEIPGVNAPWGSDLPRMFPQNIQDQFQHRNESVARMLAHIEYRRTHPEEPPLIVLSATPTP